MQKHEASGTKPTFEARKRKTRKLTTERGPNPKCPFRGGGGGGEEGGGGGIQLLTLDAESKFAKIPNSPWGEVGEGGVGV